MVGSGPEAVEEHPVAHRPRGGPRGDWWRVASSIVNTNGLGGAAAMLAEAIGSPVFLVATAAYVAGIGRMPDAGMGGGDPGRGRDVRGRLQPHRIAGAKPLGRGSAASAAV